MVKKVAPPYSLPLTQTEMPMVYLFGQKFTNREVADRMLRSVHTVATYRNRILRQFQTDDIQVVYKMVASLGGFQSIQISDLFRHKKIELTKKSLL
jgi:DNA-binding CsgD family transcriptional regulator